MELQPPQQPITTITQSNSNNPNKPIRALPTNLQLHQDHHNLKVLSKQVGVLTKYLKELSQTVEKLEEDFEVHENATDKELESLDGRCLKIELSYKAYTKQVDNLITNFNLHETSTDKDLTELHKDLTNLNNKFTQFKKTNDQLISLENSLSSPEKTIIQEKTSKRDELLLKLIQEQKELLSKLTEEQEGDHSLLLLHMESYATTDDKINKQEETLKKLNKEISECKNSQANLLETIEFNQKELKLADRLLAEEIVGLKSNQSSHTSSHTKTLETINSMLTDLMKSIDSVEKKNKSLENIVTQQTQSISTLRKWLMALGGGSAIALTIWLWHYTHK